jgi:hypothetical protein
MILSKVSKISEEYRAMCNDKSAKKLVKAVIQKNQEPLIVANGKETLYDLLNEAKPTNPLAVVDVRFETPKIEKNQEVAALSEYKSFLMIGKIVTIYKENGSTRKFHLFMTNDLKEFACKKQNSSAIKNQWRLPIQHMKGLNTGYDSKSAFNKTKGLFSKSKPRPSNIWPDQLGTLLASSGALCWLCVWLCVLRYNLDENRA